MIVLMSGNMVVMSGNTVVISGNTVVISANPVGTSDGITVKSGIIVVLGQRPNNSVTFISENAREKSRVDQPRRVLIQHCHLHARVKRENIKY